MPGIYATSTATTSTSGASKQIPFLANKTPRYPNNTIANNMNANYLAQFQQFAQQSPTSFAQSSPLNGNPDWSALQGAGFSVPFTNGTHTSLPNMTTNLQALGVPVPMPKKQSNGASFLPPNGYHGNANGHPINNNGHLNLNMNGGYPNNTNGHILTNSNSHAGHALPPNGQSKMYMHVEPRSHSNSNSPTHSPPHNAFANQPTLNSHHNRSSSSASSPKSNASPPHSPPHGNDSPVLNHSVGAQVARSSPQPPRTRAIPSHEACFEKLTVNNQYLTELTEAENRLIHIRHRLAQGDTSENLVHDIQEMLERFQAWQQEFEEIKANHYLNCVDFVNLLSLEEFLNTCLIPQLSLYHMDYRILTTNNVDDVPIYLSIISQEHEGPISKEKTVGTIAIRLLTGATVSQVQCGLVQSEFVSNSKGRRCNLDVDGSKLPISENGTVTFHDIRFTTGTFPNLVRLRFKVAVQLCVQGNKPIAKTIETTPSRPFIAMTNTGSQWKEAAGIWFKAECFGENSKIPMPRLWNYFQRHYLKTTKQTAERVARPLYMKDFEYLLRVKFGQGIAEMKYMTDQNFAIFWDWIGPALKKIRYQKHLLWMFENGFMACFVTNEEATAQLKHEPVGTFLIRLSERVNGELVISYVHSSGIRHYLVQVDDTAAKNKTIVDFIGNNDAFAFVLMIITQPNGERLWIKQNKDVALQKFYKKAKPVALAPVAEPNPYDSKIPGSEFT